MSLSDTPRSDRLHIGIFGKRNSGKSSLINALTGHSVALVSETAGTTTDPVYKSMELHPIGPVVFIDTAGFDDEGDLGRLRVERTNDVIKKTDIAILIFEEGNLDREKNWFDKLKEAGVPIVPVINKLDKTDRIALQQKVSMEFDLSPILVSALKKEGMDKIKDALTEKMPEEFHIRKILGSLVSEGETVLLIMPQDIQAPRGRLILPQVQIIRELLDNKCVTVCATADKAQDALSMMHEPPKLIITDSQVFDDVYRIKPEESKLTSFSVLLAAYKGDAGVLAKGARKLDELNENSRILIAEACTHAPLKEDIGREKIPARLRKLYGENLKIDFVNGSDFPKNTDKYDLIIHCGSCMFNRKYTMSRINQAEAQGTPITNYGMVLAKLAGILDKVIIPT